MLMGCRFRAYPNPEQKNILAQGRKLQSSNLNNEYL
jgi:hypothetical protein